MTNQQHPITPSPEQIYLWQNDWKLSSYEPGITETIYVATQAACWGSDQELEACCKWLEGRNALILPSHLRAARRPKPPSLKEQALVALGRLNSGALCANPVADRETIRRALEQLDD